VACDEIAAFVRTTIGVPAGTIAANEVVVTTQPDNSPINNILGFITKIQEAFLALGLVVECNLILRASRLIRTLDLGPMRRMRLIELLSVSGKTDMPLRVTSEPEDIYVLQISGVLKRSEFAASQKDVAQKIDIGSKPRILAILENFEGWERGADWNDLDFLITHGGKIGKIAVVADPQWQVQALAFAGAGVRGAPVRFFRPTKQIEARNWLKE
jgi:SpoIIAA-like